MTRPVSAGDVCLVTGGQGLSKSPNVGLMVTVRSAQGEHSRYGRIWRCEGAGVQQLTDGGGYQVTGWADFAADWLQRIDPPTPPAKTRTKELAHN